MIESLGWDVGGAHLKAVGLDASGKVLAAIQQTCPLWRGLEVLQSALGEILLQWSDLLSPTPRHTLTMTGELADIFTDRHQGVVQITALMASNFGADNVKLYAGRQGLVVPDMADTHWADIASANWLASAQVAAKRYGDGLWVDMGSTTTDIVLLQNGQAHPIGLSDGERLASGELVYTGVVRTPLMAVAQRVSFQGKLQRIAAEYFATMADVYRLLGELDEAHDMADSADGAGKTVPDSARRLARMVGRDAEEAGISEWKRLANEFAQAQRAEILSAILSVKVRHPATNKLIGAGAGRFVLRQLALENHMEYQDFGEGMAGDSALRDWVAVCAPAYAVAWLGLQDFGARA